MSADITRWERLPDEYLSPIHDAIRLSEGGGGYAGTEPVRNRILVEIEDEVGRREERLTTSAAAVDDDRSSWLWGIHPGNIGHVLLPDGWHEVDRTPDGELQVEDGIASFDELDTGRVIRCPTASVLAVREGL